MLKNYITKGKKRQNTSMSICNSSVTYSHISQEIIDLPSQIEENQQIIQEIDSQEISSLDISFIKMSLRNNFLFSYVDENVIENLISQLSIFKISTGEILYKEGYEGFFFFIVKSGKFIATSSTSNNIQTVLTRSDTFGEDALLNNSSRNNTIMCEETGELYLLDAKTFRNTVYTINKLDYKERIHFIKLIPMFRWIDNNELSSLSDCLIKCDFGNERYLVRKGMKGESIFLVLKGQLKCIYNDQVISYITDNNYIGETYMLFNLEWPFDVITSDSVQCYQLLKSDVKKYLGDDYEEKFIYAICKEALSKTKLFKYLLSNVDNILVKIFNKMKTKIYEKNKVIVPKDQEEEERKMIIVISGYVYKNNTQIAERAEMLNEDLIINQENIEQDLYTKNHTVITKEILLNEVISLINISISKQRQPTSHSTESVITTMLPKLIQTESIIKNISLLLDFYERITHLKKIAIFKNISDRQLLDIGKLMAKKHYRKDDIVIKEGTSGEYLYFLYNGRVKIVDSKGKKLREYRDCVCFGEISLLMNIPHTATVISLEDSDVYLLSKKDFDSITDNNMINYLTSKMYLVDSDNISLTELYYVDKLGEGKFGHVSLVHDGKNTYAIKAVNKHLAQRKKMLSKYFIKERTILLSIDHPFIIRLIKTFQNNEYIFYLMEYVHGMDLSKYLAKRQEKNLRNKYETQFYIASLLLIVHYLHSKKIAHRDIKSENIMIDDTGYIKIIDFNTCVEIKDLTNTITGTPHYMAPELLIGKGYSFPVDYWSIGILAYKIYFGYFPFGNNMFNPMDIYYDIVKHDLSIPFDTDNDFTEFIKKLLNKDPKERLCNLSVCKNEKFFYLFDWDGVTDMKLLAPYEPQIQKTTMDIIKNKEKKYVDMLSKLEMQSLSCSEQKDGTTSSFNPDWANEF